MINAASSNIYARNTFLSNILANAKLYQKPVVPDDFKKNVFELQDGPCEVQATLIGTMPLADREGEVCTGQIAQNYTKSGRYYALKDGELLCAMTICDGGNSLIVDKLYGQYGRGEYKGAGTALLKEAVKKSKKLGYNGKLSILMAGSPLFYYKNNLRIKDNQEGYLAKNAILDYAAREGADISKLWHKDWFGISMELDEKGAQALLENRRLYKETVSFVLDTKQIELEGATINADIDYCEFGDKFVIQIIDKDAKENAQIAYIEGTVENGKPSCTKMYDGNSAELSDILYSAFIKIQGFYTTPLVYNF